MPVDLHSHNPEDDVDLAPGSNKARIVKLLYDDPSLGYRPAEIDDLLEIPKGSITTALLRLHDDGLVGKTEDGYYHALEDRDDLRRFASGLVQIEELTDRYAEEGLTPADAEQTKPRSEQLGGQSKADHDAVDEELDALDAEFE